jgi:hypothetical protein
MLALAARVKGLIQVVKIAAYIQTVLAHQHTGFSQASVESAVAVQDTIKDHVPHCFCPRGYIK